MSKKSIRLRMYILKLIHIYFHIPGQTSNWFPSVECKIHRVPLSLFASIDVVIEMDSLIIIIRVGPMSLPPSARIILWFIQMASESDEKMYSFVRFAQNQQQKKISTGIQQFVSQLNKRNSRKTICHMKILYAFFYYRSVTLRCRPTSGTTNRCDKTIANLN